MTEQKIRQNVDGASDGVGGWDSWKVWEDQFDKLKQLVDSMKPDNVDKGGRTYNTVSGHMSDSMELIYNQSRRMAEAWGGEAAEKAMAQMNTAYRQAREIYLKSYDTGRALVNHAVTQRNWQAQYGSGGPTDGWVQETLKWGAAAAVGPLGLLGNNATAGAAMHQVNVDTENSNNQFPEGIRQDMPLNRDIGDPGFKPPGGGGDMPKTPNMPGGGGPGGMPSGMPSGSPSGMPTGPGGPGDMPGGPGGIPGGGSGIPGGGGPGDMPGGPGSIPGGGGIGSGPGSDLASMPPGGGPGGMPGGGPGLSGGGPGGMPGGGVGGGPGGMPAGAAGAGMGGAFPAGAAGMGRGAAGMGMGGMPMGGMGGGGRGDGDEHERSTWLTEDEDVWGGGDDAAPPVIG